LNAEGGAAEAGRVHRRLPAQAGERGRDRHGAAACDECRQGRQDGGDGLQLSLGSLHRQRAGNNNDPSWPETLQGKAKEFYDRYQRFGKSQGYKLKAMIINFPDGIPGTSAFS
jgi:hypothetical protein